MVVVLLLSRLWYLVVLLLLLLQPLLLQPRKLLPAIIDSGPSSDVPREETVIPVTGSGSYQAIELRKFGSWRGRCPKTPDINFSSVAHPLFCIILFSHH